MSVLTEFIEPVADRTGMISARQSMNMAMKDEHYGVPLLIGQSELSSFEDVQSEPRGWLAHDWPVEVLGPHCLAAVRDRLFMS